MAEPLSPAAQAVDSAVYGPGLGATRRQVAAAALEAAADQVVPEHGWVGLHPEAVETYKEISKELLAIAKRAIESCLAQRDEVLAAFIAKHGFQPEDAIQVEQRQPDGTSTWRIERRPEPQPKPEELPLDYIDAEHTGHEREMLEVFYKACRSEGGTADEIQLRGLKAVLSWGRPAIEPVPVSERLPGPEDCDAEGGVGCITSPS